MTAFVLFVFCFRCKSTHFPLNHQHFLRKNAVLLEKSCRNMQKRVKSHEKSLCVYMKGFFTS